MRTTAAAPALLALVALAPAGCGGGTGSDGGGDSFTEAPDSSDGPRDDPGYPY